VGKNSTLSSVGSQHKASQSDYGGGRETVGRVSSLNHIGGDGTELRD